MKKFTMISAIVVMSCFIGLMGCRRFTQPKVSKKMEREMISSIYMAPPLVWVGLPTSWMGGMGGEYCKIVELNAFSYEVGKSLKETNGGKLPEMLGAQFENAWPVTAHATGIAGVQWLPRGEGKFSYVGGNSGKRWVKKKFSGECQFMLYHDIYGKWRLVRNWQN